MKVVSVGAKKIHTSQTLVLEDEDGDEIVLTVKCRIGESGKAEHKSVSAKAIGFDGRYSKAPKFKAPADAPISLEPAN